MTKSDVHKSFKLLMDKNAEAVSFGGCPAFLTEEIDIFLDLATLLVISNKFTGTLNNALFESNVKRISDLQELVKNHSIEPDSLVYSKNMVSFTLPEDFMYFVNGYVTIDSVLNKLTLINHTDATNFTVTADNNPVMFNPVATILSNKLLVYYDLLKGIPSNVSIDYLIKPSSFTNLDANTEVIFNDNLTNEIINRAVIIALDNIESQRTLIKAQLNNIQE